MLLLMLWLKVIITLSGFYRIRKLYAVPEIYQIFLICHYDSVSQPYLIRGTLPWF